jgi:phosphoenolpyruvate-protein kinase (PTS system EI component)
MQATAAPLRTSPTIRLLDVGGDKPLRSAHAQEANPSLGLRGIRCCGVGRPAHQLAAFVRLSREQEVQAVPMVRLEAHPRRPQIFEEGVPPFTSRAGRHSAP